MENTRSADLDLTLQVNGRARRLQLDSRVTLLDTLREHLGLTGTKKGCDRGRAGPARSCSTAGGCCRACCWRRSATAGT